MPLALGPWDWASIDGTLCWARPAGASAALDFRTPAQCALPGPTAQGRGLFYFDGAVPGGYNVVGDYEDTLGLAARRAIENRLGLAQDSIQATRVGDILFEILTDHRDATGIARAPGLMPDHRGRLELWMSGLRVRAEAFDIASPRWPLIREQLRVDRRALEAEIQAGRLTLAQARKVLGFWARKYKCDYTEFFAAGETVVEPLPPETTLPASPPETFTYSNGSLPSVSSSAWADVEGGWSVVSNTARGDQPFTTNFHTARYQSDLSGADHYCQVDADDLGDTGAFCGATCRMPSSGNTFYGGRMRRSATNEVIHKVVTGTPTNLTTGTTNTSATLTCKLEVSGSTITLYKNGSSLLTTTDTAITGNLRCGMYGHPTQVAAGDNWRAEDLAAGGHPAFRRLGRVPAGVQGVRIH